MTVDVPTALITDLARIVGADHVLSDAADLRAAAADGLRLGRAALAAGQARAEPIVVVRPASTKQIVSVLGVVRGAGLPIVARGGGTGLMGGAATVQASVVLEMARMDRVVAVSTADRTATVQAGVVLADLNAALAPHGLICGHDPWTVPIATVGGVIGTHGLGYLGARYGSIGDQVLGLEVVLADGTVVRTRAAERSSTGPQLRRLWIGAEGTLGVVTEATLRVFPIPERRSLHALAFPTFADGFGAACDMAAIGLRPSLIDYGGPPRGGMPARMMLGFEGYAEEVEAAARRALWQCLARGATDLGPEEAQSFWDERHVDVGRIRQWRSGEQAEPRPGTPGSSLFEYMHVYVPASRVLTFLDRATATFEARGGRVTEWGLWNQPELVSLVVVAETGTPAALAALREAHDDAAMLAQDLGGSMEYVHGVGVRLAHLMAREHGQGLTVLRRIKRALDPDGMLNPGKLGL